MTLDTQLNVRFDKDTLKRVDDWRRKQRDLPGRPEAVRRLVDLALPAEKPASRERPTNSRRA
jgi:hypothetical protein